MKHSGTVYKIVNDINDKVYIGLTTMELKDRWCCHKSESKHEEPRLVVHKAIKKYGYEHFQIIPLCSSDSEEELSKMEKYFISTYNTVTPNGYNLTYGGELNTIQSEQTRLKKSIIQKELYKNDPTLKDRRQIGIVKYWKDRDQQKLKLRSDKIKQAWTYERREEMSTRNIGHKRANGNTHRRFPIKVMNELTKQEYTFDSIFTACKELNLTASAVSCCLSGVRKRHKGYTFQRILK